MEIEELLDSGVVVLDKPPGLSSHEITSFVRKITGAKRAGHAGTLDPNVSGVLPIALGRATKLLDYIVAKDKVYVCLIKFRVPQSKERVLELFSRFTGEIVQTPPKISAVRKVPRKRVIHYIKLLEHDGRLALFETKTQAGTYVRTLCEDIGKICGGARMEELRRISVGSIKEEECCRMDQLIDSFWLMKERGDPSFVQKLVRPVEEYIRNYKKAVISEKAALAMLSGAQLAVPGIMSMEDFSKDELVAIYMQDGKLAGMARSLHSSEEIKRADKGIVFKTERMHLKR